MLQYTTYLLHYILGFPDSSVGKESARNAGDPGLILGLGRSAGEGIGYPLQYSCLQNPMDRGAWQLTVYGVQESDITRTRTHTQIMVYHRILNIDLCAMR